MFKLQSLLMGILKKEGFKTQKKKGKETAKN